MSSSTDVGKVKRLNRLFSQVTGKTVIVPLDDSLIIGATMGLEQLGSKIEKIGQSSPDAVIGFMGLFRNYAAPLLQVPGILNLTASTIRSQHTRKMSVGTVSQAVQLGMDGVAVHVNISSKYESDMLQTFGVVARECGDVGMPLIAIMYPRSEATEGDENYDEMKQVDRKQYAELIAHAARVGVELGADVIKTQYTGDQDSFRSVVEACGPIPVITAGGPALPFDSMVQMAYDVICAGGAGVSYGRNVYTRENPQAYIAALKAIVHKGMTPDEVIGQNKELSQSAKISK